MVNWGPWTSGHSQEFRVGIEWRVTSGSSITVEYWIEDQYGSTGDSQTLTKTGTYGGSRTVSFSNNGGQRRITTSTFSASPGWSGSVGGRVTGIYNGATPSHSVTASVPDSADPPGVVDEPRTIPQGPRSVYVSWLQPATNGSAIDQYQVRIERGGNLIQSENQGGNDRNRYFYNLDKNTRYGARVRARNAVDWGGWSNFSYFTTEGTVPGRPDEPTADQIDSHSMRWVWNVSEDTGGLDRTAWRLQVATDSQFNNIVENRYESNLLRNHTVTGLDPDTRYYARVRIYNAIGPSSWSPVGDASTRVGEPGVPRGLRVVDKSATTVTVAWEPPISNGGAPIDHYRVSRNGTFFIVTDLDAYFTHLDPNSTNFVDVQAHNSSGYGPWHGRLYFTMLAGLWVGTGSGWRPAAMYVGTGTEWAPARPHVGNGSGWSG